MSEMVLRGQWVLVTGASSGLGQAMARKLARDYGANLVIVARRRDRLEALKQELESSARVQVAVVTADLSRTEEVDRAIAEALEGRKLRAAVLNAGVTHFGHYDELSFADFELMLATNVAAVVRMTTELIPHLERNDGGILLVSSMAGIIPIPFQSAYSGTKAFLVHFGVGLAHELSGRSVSVTVYAPGGIQSEMTAGEKFGALRSWLMDVDAAASEGIAAMTKRKQVHVPGFTNRIGAALAGMLPRRLVVGQLGSAYRRALRAAGAHKQG